jgi:plasmid stability protein
MRNITLSVDDDVYHRARVFAAKHDTSLSRLVAEILEYAPQLKQRTDQMRAAEAARADPIVNAGTNRAS